MKKSLLMLLCCIGLIFFVFSCSPKTFTLPSGEVVCNLNGDWDVNVINYGEWAMGGAYKQACKITQTGGSFTAVRLMKDTFNAEGSKFLQGELDKQHGFKKVTASGVNGDFDGKGKISDDCGTITIDVANKFKFTATRK